MKRLFTFVIITCLLFSLSACNKRTQDVTIQDVALYVTLMEFHTSIGTSYLYYVDFEEQGFTEIVFVHSEEEFFEGNFPSDAIMVWPSLFSRLMLEGMNSWIQGNEDRIDIETYSLSMPLTVSDTIDDWDNVRSLLLSISSITPTCVQTYAFNRYRSIISSELEILGEAFEASDIDVTEYGFVLPFSFWDFFYGYEFYFDPENFPGIDVTGRQVIFVLYEKLDEDIRMQIMSEIPFFVEQYRAELRRIEWDVLFVSPYKAHRTH